MRRVLRILKIIRRRRWKWLLKIALKLKAPKRATTTPKTIVYLCDKTIRSSSAETSIISRFLEMERRKRFCNGESKLKQRVFSSTLCVYVFCLRKIRRHVLLGERTSYSYLFFFLINVPLISCQNGVYSRTKGVKVYFRTTCCFLQNLPYFLKSQVNKE